MNLKTLVLISLLLVLMFIAVKVLADVRAERIKINLSEPCVEKIEEAAEAVDGVIQTNWDDKKGELEIVFQKDKISFDEIEQAISDAGFNTPNYNAPEDDVKQLPEDCRTKQAIIREEE